MSENVRPQCVHTCVRELGASTRLSGAGARTLTVRTAIGTAGTLAIDTTDVLTGVGVGDRQGDGVVAAESAAGEKGASA